MASQQLCQHRNQLGLPVHAGLGKNALELAPRGLLGDPELIGDRFQELPYASCVASLASASVRRNTERRLISGVRDLVSGSIRMTMAWQSASALAVEFESLAGYASSGRRDARGNATGAESPPVGRHSSSRMARFKAVVARISLCGQLALYDLDVVDQKPFSGLIGLQHMAEAVEQDHCRAAHFKSFQRA